MPPTMKGKPHDFRRDIFAILFLAAGVFTGLALLSYSPTDPALNSVSNVEHVRNLGGIVGAYLADILLIVLGLSAYLTPVVLLTASVLQFSGRGIRLRVREALAYGGVIGFAAAIIHLRFEAVTIRGHAIAGGGIIGGLLGGTLETYLNRPGAYVISTAALLLFFTLATGLSPLALLRGLRTVALIAGAHLGRALRWIGTHGVAGIVALAKRFGRELIGLRHAFHRAPREPKAAAAPEPSPRIFATRDKGEVVTLDPIAPKARAAAGAEPSPQPPRPPAPTAEMPGLAPKILKRADAKRRKAGDEQLSFHRMTAEGYEAPPLSLLDAPERGKVEVDEETLKANSLLLSKKLKDFDVDGKVTAIHPGPVITMYEFEPAAGTKVGKIVNLQDDLSLTLGGRSVRIVPHLPGKAALGIEIPNSDREIVWLKDIIASSQFHKSSTRLALALGSSAAGHPMIADLTKMPHLLVAGATGSGKSVAINSFILSILYKSAPADVRFILVDPKMLELSVYDGIPHLLLPVVTKPKPAVQAMRWAIREMERRYRLMADSGTRNILGYNEKVKKGMVALVSEEEAAARLAENREAVAHTGHLPYIVIIIDELADLMMVASQEMEEAITRLAQMARAAGIHLILATQRPSVDVITGLIKANFPARIAFKVTARHDSRTILDGIGAEQLLGNGDMLFMTPQGGNIVRIHGSFVTDSDIARVVTHLKEQGEPIYNEAILAEQSAGGPGGFGDDEDDELYDQAVRLVADTKQASISMVQRRLRIGYNRAARMIERMEAEGVVGPAEGSKPRQVLVNAVEG